MKENAGQSSRRKSILLSCSVAFHFLKNASFCASDLGRPFQGSKHSTRKRPCHHHPHALPLILCLLPDLLELSDLRRCV